MAQPVTKSAQGPANVVAARPLASTTPPTAPTSSSPNLWDSAKGHVNSAISSIKPAITQFAGNIGGQFGRAKAHYGLSTAAGQNPLQAGLGAFGQLDPSTRGVAGGAAGMLGAGLLAPKGTRRWAMPLMTGLGAAAAHANGPDGFKLENMLKPEALTAGALGAGAGALGSMLLGGDDDEEEDGKTDLLGNPVRRSSGSGSGIGTLGTLAGLGAGAYGLYRAMGNGQEPANTGGAATQQPADGAQGTGPTGLVGGGNAVGNGNAVNQPPGLPGGVRPAPQQATTSGNQPAGPPGNSLGVNPLPPVANNSVPASGQGTVGQATPPLPTTPPGTAVPREIVGPPAPTTSPGAMPGTKPVSDAMRGFVDNPAGVRTYAQNPNLLPSDKQNLTNLVSSFHQSEVPGLNTTGFPRLSDIYRQAYSNNDPALFEKAKNYQAALDSARQAAGAPDWASLNRLESLREDPTTGVATPAMKGLHALGAFGFQDLDGLANAAAQGDPRAIQALQVAGPEFRQQLQTSLTSGGYHKFRPLGATEDSHLPAIASNPRAAALGGALQHANLANPLTPAPYDPRAMLGGVDAIRNLPPEQKAQLLQDIGGEGFGERFSSFSPEERQAVARNLAGALSRQAYGKLHLNAEAGTDNLGQYMPTKLPGYLDEQAQKAVAAAGGVEGFKPLSMDAWRTLSKRGISPGQLGPYDQSGQVWSPKGLLAGGQVDPADMVLNQGKNVDVKHLADWQKVLTGHATGANKLSPEQLGALGVQMQHLVEARPDLYDSLEKGLKQQYPEEDWRLSDWWNDKQLDQTGRRVDATGAILPPKSFVNPQGARVFGSTYSPTFYN